MEKKTPFSYTSLCLIPNFFTLLRIVLTPSITYFILNRQMKYACLLFLVAALTDFFDGFFARYLKQVTQFGAFLDACADKILLLSCFCSFIYTYSDFSVLSWYVGLLISKEIIQIVGFVFLWMNNKSIHIQPIDQAKISTFLQIIVIFWLFCISLFDAFPPIPYGLLGVSSFFIVNSLIRYSRDEHARLCAQMEKK